MRLWSLHPSYLDAKGLVALWREGLLAQKVLRGKTRGYKHHPQLHRFREQKDPKAAIAFYLQKVWEEARARGYCFDGKKISSIKTKISLIKVSRGQLAFEMRHLRQKLKRRDLGKYRSISSLEKVKAHPLFRVTAGGVAAWEKIT